MYKNFFFASFLLASASLCAQVGINTSTPDPSSVLEIKSDSKGLLIPRIVLQNSTQKLGEAENALSLLVYNLGSENLSSGFYSWDGAKWVKFGSGQNTAEDFFYMPSVVLPTIPTDELIQPNSNYKFENKIYEVDLFGLFSSQFKTPMISSSSDLSGLASFVKTAGEYNYYVTFYDKDLFDNVTVSADGKLKYTIKEDAIVRSGSFMNIVLKPIL